MTLVHLGQQIQFLFIYQIFIFLSTDPEDQPSTGYTIGSTSASCSTDTDHAKPGDTIADKIEKKTKLLD